MLKQPVAGKIYPAALRTCSESPLFRRLSLFPDPEYLPQQEAYPVLALNDETLAPKHTVFLDTSKAKTLHLMPLYGMVKCRINEQTYSIKPGMLFVQSLFQGDVVKISNPYSDELINYLQMATAPDSAFPASARLNFFNLNKTRGRNKLVEIYKTGHPAISCSYKKISMARLAERTDLTYLLQDKDNMKCLSYVIDGEFEVGGRLLHSRDGLMLWNTDEIDLEALSRDAVILLMEYGY